ncbi:hypothetical protein [Herbidospora daliensis]|uniref:hypothetical protein n=1 Tax=Herbidospora daliensis TaxID=295585 RepID=UPI000AA36367|nr:hypothetical protein [Herbidospora daliensis]
MFPTSLPPTADSPALAAAWARSIAQAEFPKFADAAEDLARDLVSQAIPAQPPPGGHHVQLQVGLTDEGRLRVEVHAPFATSRGGAEWASLYSLTKSFETTNGADGHHAWAELGEAV